MNDYYPFGLTMPGRSSNSANPNDNYKFTGHERDEEAGMMFDYMNARTYDPALGRFLQIDPLDNLAHPKEYIYHSISPFAYSLNNPVRYYDPNGLWVVTIQYAARGQFLLSGQAAIGIAVDEFGNIGVFLNLSGGCGIGFGATPGLEASVFPHLKNINQLKGWGTSGGVYSAMLAGFGLEFNTTADFFGESGIPDGDRSQWGISASLYTPATLGGGVGFGSYVELGYTFLWEIGNLKNLKKLKEMLMEDKYGYNEEEADDIINKLREQHKKYSTNEGGTRNWMDNLRRRLYYGSCRDNDGLFTAEC
jgi:RHS repeat-associated protein